MELKHLLLETQRRQQTQRKKITIIDPNLLPEFFDYLDKSDLDDIFKSVFSVMLSGGLRVTELLSLRRCDIFLDDGFGVITVLKKPSFKVSKVTGKKLKCSKVRREFPLHPIAIKYLKKQLKGVKHFEKIFKISRNLIWRKCKYFSKHFCPHSFRHSHISNRLHTREESISEVAVVMEIDFNTVASYNHINVRNKNKNYWGT